MFASRDDLSERLLAESKNSLENMIFRVQTQTIDKKQKTDCIGHNKYRKKFKVRKYVFFV